MGPPGLELDQTTYVVHIQLFYTATKELLSLSYLKIFDLPFPARIQGKRGLSTHPLGNKNVDISVSNILILQQSFHHP